MEQQAGQINWAPYNPLPAQGTAALWTAQGYAHGCDVVSHFRWRAATAALELPGRPNAPVTARIALLHDYESLWVYDAQPHNADATYWRQLMLFYTALRSLGADVRHPDHDLSAYDMVVAPAIQLVGEERAQHLAEAAQEALLLVGPRTAYRTPTGRVHEDGQPGPLTPLLGCRLKNVDAMRPGLSERNIPYEPLPDGTHLEPVSFEQRAV